MIKWMLVDYVYSIKFTSVRRKKDAMNEPNSTSVYDRMISSLKGLPDVVEVKPATVRVTPVMVGASQTYIVQTVRQREVGDFVFLEIVDASGAVRVALPPQVADCIARQREALVTKVRRRAAKRVAQERKDRGEQPAFMKARKK